MWSSREKGIKKRGQVLIPILISNQDSAPGQVVLSFLVQLLIDLTQG